MPYLRNPRGLLRGHADVLKRLRPDPFLDDLCDLLDCAALWPRKEIIEVLIAIEANPRNKGNGGSSAVDRCLSHIRFAGFDPWHSKGTPKSGYKLREMFEALELLFNAGARWSPDDASAIKSVRRDLLSYESRATVDFLTLLVKHTACDRSSTEALLSSPQMKQHLSSERWKMARLLLGFPMLCCLIEALLYLPNRKKVMTLL